jgi:hypothetical protein
MGLSFAGVYQRCTRFTLKEGARCVIEAWRTAIGKEMRIAME